MANALLSFLEYFYREFERLCVPLVRERTDKNGRNIIQAFELSAHLLFEMRGGHRRFFHGVPFVDDDHRALSRIDDFVYDFRILAFHALAWRRGG